LPINPIEYPVDNDVAITALIVRDQISLLTEAIPAVLSGNDSARPRVLQAMYISVTAVEKLAS
jgi:hypothetical protein